MTPLLHIQINANSPEELQTALRCFAAHFTADDVAGARVTGDNVQADLVVHRAAEPKPARAAKKPAAASKTEAAAAVEAEPEVKHEPAPEETPATAQAEPEEKPAEAKASIENPVSDLTPDAARADAIKRLQTFFGKNPNNMSVIAKLQTKYGVKMFSEVPDDKAHAFLADAKLIESGVSPA